MYLENVTMPEMEEKRATAHHRRRDTDAGSVGVRQLAASHDRFRSSRDSVWFEGINVCVCDSVAWHGVCNVWFFVVRISFAKTFVIRRLWFCACVGATRIHSLSLSTYSSYTGLVSLYP